MDPAGPAPAAPAAPAAPSGGHGSSTPLTDLTVKATGEEARNYDFATARGNIKTTNVIESIGHMVKSCLGGGVVGIHEAYKKFGLIPAVVMNLILGIFVAYCMNAYFNAPVNVVKLPPVLKETSVPGSITYYIPARNLILVANTQVMYGRLQIPALSYPDLAEATLKTGPFLKLRRCGRAFRYAVDVTIGIDLFGSCCVYAVIIARSIKQLLEDSGTWKGIEIRILIACLLVPVILICMITELKYLAPFSIVADIFILIVMIATIYYGSKAATKSPSEFATYKDFEGMLEFLGVCVFSMEGVGVSLPIENHMKEPKKFPLVLFGGMGTVIAIVMLIGFFGYWGWGESAVAPVTNNMPWNTFPIILKCLMAIMIYITFALNFWVPFDLVWVYLKRRHANNSKCKLCFWERMYRAVFVTIIILIAVAFPDVSSFMGFLGCFCLSLMGFIFPAFIEICVIYEDPGFGCMKWRLVKNSLIIAFGVFLCVTGTYANAKGLIASASDKKK